MPEMSLHIRWPDGSEDDCYSPSSVIRDFFAPGTAYPLGQFLDLSRTALSRASQRVEAVYGHPCSMAAAELARIEARGRAFAGQPAAQVTCLAIRPTS